MLLCLVVNLGVWEECSYCDTTGYYRNKDCPRCQGVGYLFIDRREKAGCRLTGRARRGTHLSGKR